jgi:hypothetical protein
MSFLRHEEIYPCGEGESREGAILANRAPAHRNDESPAGYSSAGCSPAEPASASPAGAIMLRWISLAKNFAVNGKLSPISLSQLVGALRWMSPVSPAENIKPDSITERHYLPSWPDRPHG